VAAGQGQDLAALVEIFEIARIEHAPPLHPPARLAHGVEVGAVHHQRPGGVEAHLRDHLPDQLHLPLDVAGGQVQVQHPRAALHLHPGQLHDRFHVVGVHGVPELPAAVVVEPLAHQYGARRGGQHHRLEQAGKRRHPLPRWFRHQRRGGHLRAEGTDAVGVRTAAAAQRAESQPAERGGFTGKIRRRQIEHRSSTDVARQPPVGHRQQRRRHLPVQLAGQTVHLVRSHGTVQSDHVHAEMVGHQGGGRQLRPQEQVAQRVGGKADHEQGVTAGLRHGVTAGQDAGPRFHHVVAGLQQQQVHTARQQRRRLDVEIPIEILKVGPPLDGEQPCRPHGSRHQRAREGRRGLARQPGRRQVDGPGLRFQAVQAELVGGAAEGARGDHVGARRQVVAVNLPDRFGRLQHQPLRTVEGGQPPAAGVEQGAHGPVEEKPFGPQGGEQLGAWSPHCRTSATKSPRT